VQDDKVNI